MDSKINLVGHSHIDAVWLWDRQETIEVLENTLGKMLDLMDDNPELTFVQTSAQFFKWLETEVPDLFRRIEEKVKQGKFEIVGGMWVEPDCNLPSGESLIRQLLYGKRYFKQKFDVDIKVGWLPDVFGFSWSLPQIFKKSGIDYFFTSKLNWQTALPFPHFAFWWEAADGSRILGYQTPGMYNNTNIYDVYKQFRRFQYKTGVNTFLAPYGEGDHGGGLNQQLINNALEADYDVDINFGNAQDYFQNLKTEHGDKLPEFKDELYLKTHRGTLSTLGKMKHDNRKGEIALDLAERLSYMALELQNDDYPEKELKITWEKLLFNQFHDALPGSSIKPVYEDAAEDFEQIFNTLDSIIDTKLNKLVGEIDTSGNHESLVVFNQLTWKRKGLVELPLSDNDSSNHLPIIKTNNGEILSTQVVDDKLLIKTPELPAFGYTQFEVLPAGKKDNSFENTQQDSRLSVDNTYLENDFYVIEISPKTGVITRIYDKQNDVEVLGQKGGNFIQIYQDETTKESAWNICLGRLESLSQLESIKTKNKGSVKASLEITYRYLQEGRPDSIFTLEISLNEGDPVIYFDLNVDWHAKFRTAKVGFQFNGEAEYVTYEVPNGSIMRRNPLSDDADPVDREKWEVAGQKWVDYTYNDGSYGISLLNDCKYGFDQYNDILRMTLLRSPVFPNPARMGLNPREDGVTDQGRHHIKYGLYPHRKSWREAETVNKAYEFNYPILTRHESAHTGTLPAEMSYLKCEEQNVIISAVKKAEDSTKMIVRLYESSGQSTSCVLKFKNTPQQVFEADMMENKIKEIKNVSGNNVEIGMNKNEIKTLVVQL